jgi:D-hexose-6-phosphate mutarotase
LIDQLNRDFGIEGQVEFEIGREGFPRAAITNAFARAEIYLHGAHVTAFQPRGTNPVLWMSDVALFASGKAIRGGIPVVWPWFGPHPTDAALPQHGFARTSEWTVCATNELPDKRTELRLELRDDDAARTLWPHRFVLELRVVLGTALTVGLCTRNTGDETVRVGGALHTYFHVADINGVSIEGLGGREYIDRLDANRVKREEGTISISEEVDRVYLDTTDECVVDDPALRRKIHVAKTGSRTTVVWNPWVDKARRMADFPDEGYRKMVCVETTNTADDVYYVPPGGEHTLSQTVSVESV